MTEEKESQLDGVKKLVEQAWGFRREKRFVDAQQKLSEAVALCRRAGLHRELVMALGKLGHVELDLGNIDTACKFYEEAVNICGELGEPLTLAHTVRHLGDVHRHGNRLQEAGACYERALELYANSENPPACDYANAIRPMAILKEDTGLVDEAKQLWEQARALYGAVGVREGVDECSEHLTRLDK